MYSLSKNEDGFVLVTAMLVLVLLTLLGTAAVDTTVMELHISGNDLKAKRNFYVAESGWNCGYQWLENKASPPDRQNPSLGSSDGHYSLVRNFGDGNDGITNDTFSDGSEDGTLTGRNIPYWYKLEDQGNSTAKKYGKKFRNFKYQITSDADGKQDVMVVVEKVFKVGY